LLTVLSMYFIGVSGLRVLPLSVNGMEWNIVLHECQYTVDSYTWKYAVLHCIFDCNSYWKPVFAQVQVIGLPIRRWTHYRSCTIFRPI